MNLIFDRPYKQVYETDGFILTLHYRDGILFSVFIEEKLNTNIELYRDMHKQVDRFNNLLVVAGFDYLSAPVQPTGHTNYGLEWYGWKI